MCPGGKSVPGRSDVMALWLRFSRASSRWRAGSVRRCWFCRDLAMAMLGLVTWLAGMCLRRLVPGLIGALAGGMVGFFAGGRNPAWPRSCRRRSGRRSGRSCHGCSWPWSWRFSGAAIAFCRSGRDGSRPEAGHSVQRPEPRPGRQEVHRLREPRSRAGLRPGRDRIASRPSPTDWLRPIWRSSRR